MTGYAVFVRVEPGRIVAPSIRVALEPMLAQADDLLELDEGASKTTLTGHLAARLATARETWAITTFYLFDANSWR